MQEFEMVFERGKLRRSGGRGGPEKRVVVGEEREEDAEEERGCWVGGLDGTWYLKIERGNTWHTAENHERCKGLRMGPYGHDCRVGRRNSRKGGWFGLDK